MEKFILSKTFVFGLLAIIGVSATCTSCIKDDDEETVDLVDPAKEEDLVIDESYHATAAFLQTAWIGNYSGYDENQKANTNIKRKLVLNSNGTYTNTIEGILVSKSENKSEYTPFEKEKGTYKYNGSNTITFYVQEDSLINYQNEQLEYFAKKHSYSGGSDTSKDVSNYTEKVQFNLKDGEYRWVTKDVYLSNIANKDLELLFLMTKE